MLKEKAKTAVIWSGADIFLRQGLQFGISIALARMLSPEEFGTIALLYLFVGIASAFVDSGFSSALIQRKDITHTDESTVFWFNIAIAIMMAVILALSAPVIAKFYNKPVLVGLTKVLALNIVINALGAVHGTLLSKRLDFKTPMKINAGATIFSGIVAIGLASNGYGVWSLAILTLAASFVTTISFWILSPWRPKLVISKDSARRLFGFGGYLLASNLMETIYSRFYSLLIGKIFGVVELGLYNRAEGTQQLPVNMLSGIMARVAFPLFSATEGDKEKLKRGFNLAVNSSMLINIPVMIGLIVCSELVIVCLFGEKWIESAPLMMILAVGGIFWPLHVLNLRLLMAMGHSNKFFYMEIVKKIVGILLMIASSFFGIYGIAWGVVIFGFFAFFINSFYTTQLIGVTATSQLKALIPALIISIAMGLCVRMLGVIDFGSIYFNLFVQVIFGMFLYAFFCYLFKIKALTDVLKLFGYI